jgi:hypothetical protein
MRLILPSLLLLHFKDEDQSTVGPPFTSAKALNQVTDYSNRLAIPCVAISITCAPKHARRLCSNIVVMLLDPSLEPPENYPHAATRLT